MNRERISETVGNPQWEAVMQEMVEKSGKNDEDVSNQKVYDFPSIMSEVEAKEWQMRDIPKTGLYENFGEINEHCPKELKAAINYLSGEYDYEKELEKYGVEVWVESLARCYATTAAYMDFGDLYDKNLILKYFEQQRSRRREDKRILLPADLIEENLVERLPEKYDAKNEAVPLSSALHLLHSLSPEVRSLALEYESEIKQAMAREKGIDLNLTRSIVLRVKENFGIGMDFPEDLREQVEEKLKSIRDGLTIRYSVTWSESHIPISEKPDYDSTERAVVEIMALDEETLNEAERLISNITEKEMV